MSPLFRVVDKTPQLRELLSAAANGDGWADLTQWPTETVVAALRGQLMVVAADTRPGHNLKLTRRGRTARLRGVYPETPKRLKL